MKKNNSRFVLANKKIQLQIFLVLAVTVGVAVNAQLNSQSGPFASIQIHAFNGSMMECIGSDAIANEIEISKSAMKKATQKVSGFLPKSAYDVAESSDYCALTLA